MKFSLIAVGLFAFSESDQGIRGIKMHHRHHHHGPRLNNYVSMAPDLEPIPPRDTFRYSLKPEDEIEQLKRETIDKTRKESTN